jgi:Zn-dependent protease
MNLQHIDIVDIVFKAIVFLFAISIHESAHAWMANRCGDPTARMLGRITLNPIPHIDPIGTIVFPAIGLLLGGYLFGWAKPTPVDPRNFRDPVRGDILTTVAGPVSNLLVAAVSVVILVLIAVSSPLGRDLVQNGNVSSTGSSSSLLIPATAFLYDALLINVLLAVFNMIPVPPLDGSHVLRHFLPGAIRQGYDQMGWFGMIALILVINRTPLLSILMSPFLKFFGWILTSV